MTNAIVLIENEELCVPCCVNTMCVYSVSRGFRDGPAPNKHRRTVGMRRPPRGGFARAKRINILNLIC